MKITKQMILNLIGLIDKHGLIHGAGNNKEQFCVQQAVNRVLHNDLYGQYSDNPTMDCIDDTIRSFGIRMNDCMEGLEKKERGEVLKRFAIAELGSNLIDSYQFTVRLREKLGLDINSEIIEGFLRRRPEGLNNQQALKMLADTAADVLKEMGTEGGQFLHLADEPDKEKQKQEIRKLEDKIYGARMANFGYPTCGVKPQQQKH